MRAHSTSTERDSARQRQRICIKNERFRHKKQKSKLSLASSISKESMSMISSQREREREITEPEDNFETSNIGFVLHPSLDYTPAASQTSTSKTYTIETNNKRGKQAYSRNTFKEKVMLQFKQGKQVPSVSENNEKLVTDTAGEILHQIVTGKWNYKNMIFDEGEDEGIQKLGAQQPCSNADCVRELENFRRKKNIVQSKNYIGDPWVVFEDGNLPSYHSLVNLWNSKGCNKLAPFFTNGELKNDEDFLKVWREVRRDPEAFGMRKGTSKEMEVTRIAAERLIERSHSKTEGKPINEQKLIQKPRPSREYYDYGASTEFDKSERIKLKQRYDKLKHMYPHLPVLKAIDYTISPVTVKTRLKQAEEWDKLVTITNRPQPVVQQRLPLGLEKDKDLDENLKSNKNPRYAANTASTLNKMKERVNW